RPAADRRADRRPDRDRGPRHGRAQLNGALRLALPRERGPRAAHPAPPAGSADAALAAATEGAEPAPGGAQVRILPRHPRDVPRVPPGRVRPARAEAAPERAQDAGARPRRRRDLFRLAVFELAPL